MRSELPGRLGELWPSWAASETRRHAAARKLKVYREDHLGLVNAQIDAMLGGGQAAADIQRFAHRSPNLLKSVADAVAVAYRSGCRRELRGASPDLARAFADIVDESGITRKAPGLNARAWVAGRHFVAPHLTRRGLLALDIVGPDRLDAEMTGDEAERVLWHLPQEQGGAFVLLDNAGWSYFDRNGEPTGGDVTHAVGRCPAVPFVAFDGGDDPWASSAHEGLVDATLKSAYVIAHLLYSRQVASKPQLVISSTIGELPKGQVLGHPTQPLLLPDGVASVLDITADPTQFLDVVSALITMAVSAEGLPPGSVTIVANNSDWGSLAVSAEGARLAAHRDRQVPFLHASERALWPEVCDFARGSTHRHARALPPGDEIRDMLRISFPDLSTAKEQLERIEVLKAGLPYGLTSPVDVVLAARPEVTREEVDEVQRQNLADYVARIEPLVERNVPADPAASLTPEARGYQSIAQQQGRRGGIASGETRANPEPKP